MDTFEKIIRVIVEHIEKIIILPILGMVAIFFLTKGQPREYQSNSRLFLNLQDNKNISLSEQEVKSYEVHTYFENLRELAFSRNTLEYTRLLIFKDIIDETCTLYDPLPDNLKSNPKINQLVNEKIETENSHLNYMDSLESKIAGYLDYSNLSFPALRGSISLTRLNESYYLDLSVTTQDPRRAYYIHQKFIDALIHQNGIIAKNKIQGHRIMIEKLLKEARRELDHQIATLESYKIEHGIINLAEHTKAIVGYIVDLERDKARVITDVETSKKNKESVLAKLGEKGDISLDLEDHHDVLKLQSEFERLHNAASPGENMEVMFADVKNELRGKIRSIVNSTAYDRSLVNLDLVTRYLDYDLKHQSSVNQLSGLNNEIRRVNQYARKFAPHESYITTMEHEIETSRKAYLLLLNKLNVTQSLEQRSGVSDLEIIDRPEFPLKPKPSKRVVTIVAGGVAVFVLTTALFIALALLNASIMTAEEFKFRLGRTADVVFPAQPKDKNLKHGFELIDLQQTNNLLSGVLGHKRLMVVSSQRHTNQIETVIKLKTRLEDQGVTTVVIDADWTIENDWGDIQVEKLEKDIAVKAIQDSDLMNELLAGHGDKTIIVNAPSASVTMDYKQWGRRMEKVVYHYKSGRVAQKVDKERFVDLMRRFGNTMVVLSQVKLKNMTDLVGDVPKKRSVIRKKIKMLYNRQFS